MFINLPSSNLKQPCLIEVIQLQTEWTDAYVHQEKCHSTPTAGGCGRSYHEFKATLEASFRKFTAIKKSHCLENPAFLETSEKCHFFLNISNGYDKDMAAKDLVSSPLPAAKVRYLATNS